MLGRIINHIKLASHFLPYKSQPTCLRCDSELCEVSQQSNDSTSYKCTRCNSQYTKRKDKPLHDRWPMPLTIPLYSIVYSTNPVTEADWVAKEMMSRTPEYIRLLIKHIEDELEEPKQQLADIHNFVCKDEHRLRQFLGLLVTHLKLKSTVN